MPKRRRKIRDRHSILDLEFPQTSARETQDLQVALLDALRIQQQQRIVTPRTPSSRPPEFVDEEEEELM